MNRLASRRIMSFSISRWSNAREKCSMIESLCLVPRNFYFRTFFITLRVKARNLRYETAASDGTMFTIRFSLLAFQLFRLRQKSTDKSFLKLKEATSLSRFFSRAIITQAKTTGNWKTHYAFGLLTVHFRTGVLRDFWISSKDVIPRSICTTLSGTPCKIWVNIAVS